MQDVDVEKLEKQQARWRILRALDAGRPIGVSETLILRTLGDIKLSRSPAEVRRELDYLASKKLVDLEKDRPVWHAKLTAYGIDVAEYTVDCPVGIDRPEKYWGG